MRMPVTWPLTALDCVNACGKGEVPDAGRDFPAIKDKLFFLANAIIRNAKAYTH
jgi:hypothetical protein